MKKWLKIALIAGATVMLGAAIGTRAYFQAVPSIATLQGYNTATMELLQYVNVAGYRAGSSDGAGAFTWEVPPQANGLVADGGVVIAPSDHSGTCAYGCMVKQLNGSPISPLDFGAYGTGLSISDANMNSGSNPTYLCSTSQYTFTSADVGKIANVQGAGANGAVLVGTISSIMGSCAVLSVSATTTVTNAGAQFGFDDSAAINSAISSALNFNGNVEINSNRTFFFAGQLTGSAPAGKNLTFLGNGTLLWGAPQLLNSANMGYVTAAMSFSGTSTSNFLWNGPTVNMGLFYGGTDAGFNYDFPNVLGSSFYSTPGATIPADFNYGAGIISGFANVTIQNQQVINPLRGFLVEGASGTQRSNLFLTDNFCNTGTSYLSECYLGYNLGTARASNNGATGISFEDSASDGGDVVSQAAIVCQRCLDVQYAGFSGYGVQLGALSALTVNEIISSLTVAGTTATVTTSTNHDLETGSFVYFYGITCSACFSSTNPNYYESQPFKVTVVDNTHYTFQVASGATNGSAATLPGQMEGWETGIKCAMEDVPLQTPPADTFCSGFYHTIFNHMVIRHSGDYGIQYDYSVIADVSNFDIDGTLASGLGGYDVGNLTIANGTISNIAQPYIIGGRTPSAAHSLGINVLLNTTGDGLNRFPASLNIDNVTGVQWATPTVADLGSFIGGSGIITTNSAQYGNYSGTLNDINVTVNSNIPSYIVAVPNAVLGTSATTGTAVIGEPCADGSSHSGLFISYSSNLLWLRGVTHSLSGTVTCPGSGATFTITGSTYNTGFNLGTQIMDNASHLAGGTIP